MCDPFELAEVRRCAAYAGCVEIYCSKMSRMVSFAKDDAVRINVYWTTGEPLTSLSYVHVLRRLCETNTRPDCMHPPLPATVAICPLEPLESSPRSAAELNKKEGEKSSASSSQAARSKTQPKKQFYRNIAIARLRQLMADPWQKTVSAKSALVSQMESGLITLDTYLKGDC
jgi:hypothetical protein